MSCPILRDEDRKELENTKTLKSPKTSGKTINTKAKNEKKYAPVTGIGAFLIMRERSTILCQQLRENCCTWRFTGPSSA
jgi:hypothetical protein